MTGGMYTWSNNQDIPILEKLDRILMSKDWEDLFPQVWVRKLPREVSDHNPLILASGQHRNTKSIQFRFELSWLSNPDFITAAEKIWLKPCRATSALHKIQQKLKLQKQYFKGWGFNLQGDLRKQRKNVSEEIRELEAIEELDGLTNQHMLRKSWLIQENLKLLDQEEAYWHNRCHEEWLLKGDNNTKYFHKIVNGRKRKNTILSLEHDGNIIEGDENLLKHASEYYAGLFGPREEHDIHLDSSLWADLEQVTDLDNSLLCAPFSEEVKEALCQMKKKQGSRA